MKLWVIKYTGLDGNLRTLVINADTAAGALIYANKFVSKFGMILLELNYK